MSILRVPAITNLRLADEAHADHPNASSHCEARFRIFLGRNIVKEVVTAKKRVLNRQSGW